MQSAYLEEFGQSVSQSTLCRIIKNDLKYTRKKLTRQAREACLVNFLIVHPIWESVGLHQ